MVGCGLKDWDVTAYMQLVDMLALTLCSQLASLEFKRVPNPYDPNYRPMHVYDKQQVR
jgi:hypothetical protein